MKTKMTYLISVVLLLALVGSVPAAVWNVPGDSATIQGAIDLASYGDTIFVAAGTYVENITLANGVALIGDAASTTTIDGDYAGWVVITWECDPNTLLQDFTITKGYSPEGAGIYNYYSNLIVTHCTFTDNHSTNNGGGMYFIGGSPTVTHCTFTDNHSTNNGGGIYNAYSSLNMINCIFSDNTAIYGGGIYNYISSSTVTNCIFNGNLANNNGGGMYNHDSSLTMTLCTFGNNNASSEGSGMYNLSTSPTVTNCIFYDLGGTEIIDDLSSSSVVTYSNILGGWPGEGNINSNPLFVSSSDLHLQTGSPCIDAGSNPAVPLSITTDMDGIPRFIDDPNTTDTGNGTPPIVDMGAYEYFGNHEPICNIGGPYTVNQNQSLLLDASASTPGGDDAIYGDSIVYEWDLDNDGVYDENVTINAMATVPWITLSIISKPMGSNNISLRVTDKTGLTDTASTTLTITYNPILWNPITIDSNGNVGLITSLALNSSGNPAVSYFDLTNYALKYAAWNGSSWDIQTVDDSSEWVGTDSSLVFDSSDHPRISYYDTTNGTLKYAAWDSSSWDIQIIDSGVRVGMYTSLALDSSGNPAIAYHDNGNGDLKYASFDGTNWNIEIVDRIDNVGHYASLALDNADHGHISYRDYPNGILKYAHYNGKIWTIQTVDDDGDVGFSTSIAVDSDDYPHISYRDKANSALKYAAWNGSGWVIQTVDSEGDAGRGTSIALDSNGKPRISYHENTNGDLKYAAWNGTSWEIDTIDSDGDVGDYTSLALDSNEKPVISYYDGTNYDLKLATVCIGNIPGDVNTDCFVNLLDVAELAAHWLDCTMPFDPACLP